MAASATERSRLVAASEMGSEKGPRGFGLLLGSVLGFLIGFFVFGMLL